MQSYLMYSYLAILYFIEGVPYGMQDKLLPQYLRSEKFSYSKVALARILLIPWLCKPLYASYIEGRRSQKRCLQLFLGVLTAVTWTMLFTSQSTRALVMSLLIINVVSACLDVSVDTIAMDILHGSQLAMGNAVQVGGYKVGSLFGGGALLLLQQMYGFKGVSLGLSVMYALGFTVVTLNAAEQSSPNTLKCDKHIDESCVPKSAVKDGHTSTLRKRLSELEQEPRTEENAVDELIEIQQYSLLQRLKWAFSVKGTSGLLLFLALYKAGEYGMTTTYPSFLIDRGHSYVVIGILNGFFAQLVSLVGTLAGAYFSRSSRRHKANLFWLSSARLMPAALIFLTSTEHIPGLTDLYVGVTSLLILNLISGMITTTAFTMMMTCSQKMPRGIRSTYFSLLCTVEVVGKLAFSIFVGPLVDVFGKSSAHLAMTALMGVSVATVRFLD